MGDMLLFKTKNALSQVRAKKFTRETAANNSFFNTFIYFIRKAIALQLHFKHLVLNAKCGILDQFWRCLFCIFTDFITEEFNN